MADSVLNNWNTRAGYQVLSKQCIKKKNSTMLPPHQVPWSSSAFSYSIYRLEITGKETAEECCYSYATLSIDCHFRNAYRKVKELGMSPPIQQHQRLTSLGWLHCLTVAFQFAFYSCQDQWRKIYSWALTKHLLGKCPHMLYVSLGMIYIYTTIQKQ